MHAHWECTYNSVSKPSNALQLEKYHEQAELLDPLMSALVTPLSAVLRREAAAGDAADLAAVQTASRFLWNLITVRSSRTLLYVRREHSLNVFHNKPCISCAEASQQLSSCGTWK